MERRGDRQGLIGQGHEDSRKRQEHKKDAAAETQARKQG